MLPGEVSPGIFSSLVSVPETFEDYFSKGISFDRTDDEVEMVFKIDADWIMQVVDDAGNPPAWCSISADIGSAGLHKVKVRAEENMGHVTRSAHIYLMGLDNSRLAEVVVRQYGVAVFLKRTAYEVSPSDTTIVVELQSNVDFEYRIEDGVDWLRESPAASRALMAHAMSFAVDANPSYRPREARIFFYNEQYGIADTLTLAQQGLTPALTVPDGYTDYFAQDLVFDYSAGEAEVVFHTNIHWAMQVVPADGSDVSWCTVDSLSGGVGQHKVKVRAARNATYDSRSAVLRVMCDTIPLGEILVLQNQENAILLGRREYDVSADATTIEVALSANVDFEYRILDADWVRERQSATRGLTDHCLVFEIDANPSYEPREAKIVFHNSELAVSDTLTFVQKGLVPKVSVPEGYTDYFTQGLAFGHMADETEVTFYVNVDWSISVADETLRLDIEPSSGTAGLQTVTVRVANNNLSVNRMATISLMCDTSNLAKIEVKQEKTILSLSRTTYNVSCGEGSINVELNANIDFEYKIIDADWIRELQSSHEQTKHSFVFRYDANTSIKSRKAQIVFYNSEYAKYATLNISQANVVDAVDLGLSVKWAPHNVGAESPEEYGGYYAWGETEEKSDYSWATYKWGDGNSFIKYCTGDKKNILDPEDDVAYVEWGGDWRMPTLNEVKELLNRCAWKWTTVNGVSGYNVTGPNGNSIFFPAAGYRDGWGKYERGIWGCYWSATNPSSDDIKFYFRFNNGSYESGYQYRCYGHTVRPVTNY